MLKFLRLNDANPTALRPLRVEDLQDIWSAIADMLSQDVNTPIIVSGFNYSNALLDPTVPVGSGVIAYMGKLYAYNADETPLRLDAIAYLHDDVPTDDQRQLSDGTIQTFSFKNVINGDPSSGVVAVRLSAQGINLMRSAYIAPRAIRGAEIALQQVLRENLVRNFAPVVSAQRSTNLPQDASFDNFIRFVDGHWEVSTIFFDSGTTLSLDSDRDDLAYFPDTFSVYVSAAPTTRRLDIRANIGFPITQAITVPSSTDWIITFGRVQDGYAVISNHSATSV